MEIPKSRVSGGLDFSQDLFQHAAGLHYRPILLNIYLNELDRYIEQYMASFKNSAKRDKYDPYWKLHEQIRWLKEGKYKPKMWKNKDESERKIVLQEISKKTAQKREMPVYDPMDTDYKRLQYVRYADDWICGVIGSKEDAENIKSDIKQFLSEKLHLELSDEKTLITQAKDKAQFLGFEVFVSNSNHVMTDKNCHKKRSMGGHILKSVPKNEIVNARYREKMEERKQLLQSVRAEYAKAAAELDILKAEILCVLRGKSTFSKELLSGMVSEAEAKIATLQEQLTAAQNAYNEGQAVLNALNAQYEDIISWAEMYDQANLEAKKDDRQLPDQTGGGLSGLQTAH